MNNDIRILGQLSIPRSWGVTNCKDMIAISEKARADLKACANITILYDLLEAVPAWNPNATTYRITANNQHRKKCLTQLTGQNNTKAPGIRMDKIHGKHRKILKFELKKQAKLIDNYVAVWNRYCGNDNIICVHARIGGNNWNEYGGKYIEQKPWFITKVDNYYDDTYCDIYVDLNKINGVDPAT